MVITLLPLEMLSGEVTPFESMPKPVQKLMQVAPTTHFVALAQAIVYGGADITIVWPRCIALFAIGSVFFGLALSRGFRVVRYLPLRSELPGYERYRWAGVAQASREETAGCASKLETA